MRYVTAVMIFIHIMAGLLPAATHYVRRDAAGTRMGEAYAHEFRTPKPRFTYLRRDHAPGAPDGIVEREPLSEGERTLFEAEKIGRFARGGDHLAVAIPGEGGDELRVVPTGPGEGEKVEVPRGSRISNLEFSPTEERFVFIAGRDGRPAALYRHDVEKGRTTRIEPPKGEDGFSDALFSRDGQALLYRTSDNSFYVTGATRRTKPTHLGEYESSGGFDRTNARISFEAASGSVAIFDAVERRLLELPLVGTGMVISTPTFLHNSDALIYRQDFVDENAGVTLSEVDVAYSDGRVERQFTALYPATFFGAPVLSQDDRYALIESTLDRSKTDGYPTNEQPTDAFLSLYDRESGRVVQEIPGLDPVWNR